MHVASANEDQVRRLNALLAPIGLDQASAGEGTLQALGTPPPMSNRPPTSQTLSTTG